MRGCNTLNTMQALLIPSARPAVVTTQRRGRAQPISAPTPTRFIRPTEPVDPDEYHAKVRDENKRARQLLKGLVKDKKWSYGFAFKGTKDANMTRTDAAMHHKDLMNSERERLAHIDPTADAEETARLDLPSLLEVGNNVVNSTGAYPWALLEDREGMKKNHTSVRVSALRNAKALCKDSTVHAGSVVELRVGAKKALLGYGLMRDKTSLPDSVLVDVLLWTEHEVKIDELFWNNRLRLAMQRRTGLIDFRTTTGYRLLNGVHDKTPGLYVDILNDIAYIKFHAESAPILPSLMAFLVDDMQVVAIHSQNGRTKEGSWLDVDPFNGVTNFGRPAFDAVTPTYTENGATFAVGASATKLDSAGGRNWLIHRGSRALLKALSKGKTVLDVYAGTGGFGVTALAGGASFVTCVDDAKLLSYGALQNLMLNDPSRLCNYSVRCVAASRFFAELRSRQFDDVTALPPHTADTPTFGSNSAAEPLEYDIVVCDLPVQEVVQRRNKSIQTEGMPNIRDVQPLTDKVEQCLGAVADGGYLVVTTFLDKMDNEIMSHVLRRASRRTHRKLQLIRLLNPAADFPELLTYTRFMTRQYKGFLVRVTGARNAKYNPLYVRQAPKGGVNHKNTDRRGRSREHTAASV